MHLVGFDLLDRPVMYSCLEMVTNRSIEDNRRHMISCFEQVLQQMFLFMPCLLSKSLRTDNKPDSCFQSHVVGCCKQETASDFVSGIDYGGMQCIQAMPAGVGQWVWVSDFKGFGLSDCDPRLAKVFLDLSAAHYPERLGLFLVIDAPW